MMLLFHGCMEISRCSGSLMWGRYFPHVNQMSDRRSFGTDFLNQCLTAYWGSILHVYHIKAYELQYSRLTEISIIPDYLWIVKVASSPSALHGRMTGNIDFRAIKSSNFAKSQ